VQLRALRLSNAGVRVRASHPARARVLRCARRPPRRDRPRCAVARGPPHRPPTTTGDHGDVVPAALSPAVVLNEAFVGILTANTHAKI